MAKSGDYGYYDGFAFQETHISHGEVEPHERLLHGMGLKAVACAARTSKTSSTGTNGGTSIAIRSHMRSSSYRELAARQSVSGAMAGATAGNLDSDGNGLDFCDWVPMAWHLRGYSIVIISIYLDGGVAPTAGINSKKLASLSSFLDGIDHPWIIVGDWNHSPQQIWQSGWPKQMGSAIMSLPEGSFTCFKKGSKPSLIDFALVSYKAERYVRYIEAVPDVPWRPHIGQCIGIDGEARFNIVRTLTMPRPFIHPKLEKKAPDPNSKRQKKLQKLKIETGTLEVVQDDVGREQAEEQQRLQQLEEARWEALTPWGWQGFPVEQKVSATTWDDAEADPFDDIENEMDIGPTTAEQQLEAMGGETDTDEEELASSKRASCHFGVVWFCARHHVGRLEQ